MGRHCPLLELKPSRAAHPILTLLGSVNVLYCSDVAVGSIPAPDVQEKGLPHRERDGACPLPSGVPWMLFLLTEGGAVGGGWRASGLVVGMRIPEEGSYYFFHSGSSRRPKVCWPQCFYLASFSIFGQGAITVFGGTLGSFCNCQWCCLDLESCSQAVPRAKQVEKELTG